MNVLTRFDGRHQVKENCMIIQWEKRCILRQGTGSGGWINKREVMGGIPEMRNLYSISF